MKRIPEIKPGHLSNYGPLNHQRTSRGPSKGGAATRFTVLLKNAKPIELNWKSNGRLEKTA